MSASPFPGGGNASIQPIEQGRQGQIERSRHYVPVLATIAVFSLSSHGIGRPSLQERNCFALALEGSGQVGTQSQRELALVQFEETNSAGRATTDLIRHGISQSCSLRRRVFLMTAAPTKSKSFQSANMQEIPMNDASRSLAATFGAVLSAMLLSSTAYAGCGDVLLKHKSAYRFTGNDSLDILQMAKFREQPSMIGMWAIKFMSGGVQTDFGYTVWHSDGTEFLNSGSRAPATQNYCLGVWKQTGWYTYKLSHYALSYDLNGNYVANVLIKENVTLDHAGDSFSGTFTIDATDPKTGVHLGPPLAGSIAGARVTVD